MRNSVGSNKRMASSALYRGAGIERNLAKRKHAAAAAIGGVIGETLGGISGGA